MADNNIIPPEHAIAYILAGKATVGFHSMRTGNTFWYYVNKRSVSPGLWYVWFAELAAEDDRRLGMLKLMPGPNPGPVTYMPPPLPHSPLKKEYVEAFILVWNMLHHKQYHPQVVILHKGQCGYCGRPLTDYQSLVTGIGPVCRKKLGI